MNPANRRSYESLSTAAERTGVSPIGPLGSDGAGLGPMVGRRDVRPGLGVAV